MVIFYAIDNIKNQKIVSDIGQILNYDAIN